MELPGQRNTSTAQSIRICQDKNIDGLVKSSALNESGHTSNRRSRSTNLPGEGSLVETVVIRFDHQELLTKMRTESVFTAMSKHEASPVEEIAMKSEIISHQE